MKFQPTPHKCDICDAPLQSTRPGEFVSCEHSFVDQTPYYVRYGGELSPDVEAIREAWTVALDTNMNPSIDLRVEEVEAWIVEMQDIMDETEEELDNDV